MRRRRLVAATLAAVSLASCTHAPRPMAAIAAPPRPTAPAADPEAVSTTAPPPIAPDVRVALTPSGVPVPVLDVGDHGWRVSTPCGREAVIPSATPVRQATVVLDPGHGGWDPGAVGPNGLAEAALNLAVSQHAKLALERAGVSVLLTRTDDYGMNLPNRARLALGVGAKAFVSVHHNAASTAVSATPGAEAYYQQESPDSKRLAGLVYEEVVAALSAFAVRWVSVGTGVTWRSRANGEDYFAMVRLTKGVPATLAELAFLSNPAEAALLARPDGPRVEGEAVAKGVLRFLTTADPGVGFVDGGPMPPRPRTGGGSNDGCDDPQL